jgi:hypothetical protein
MALPSNWLAHEAGLVLDARRAEGLRRRLALWSRAQGGRFDGRDPGAVVIWSGGRVAAFTMREAGGQVVVDQLYWDPERARVELVWRALGLLVGRPSEPARPDPPGLP